MRTRSRSVFAGLLLIGVPACDGVPERRPPRAHDDALSSAFTISISDTVLTGLGTDSVRRAAAAPVAFLALLGPDAVHLTPVATPSTAEVRVTEIATQGVVDLGDIVATLRETGPPMRKLDVRAPVAGRWRPGHLPGQDVGPGDLIGSIEAVDRLLASGQVDELQREFIHPGDSAVVTAPPPSGFRRSGRVERVTSVAFGAEVAVEFRPGPGIQSPVVVNVTVFPIDPNDTVLVAPASAIARLSLGPAIFVAVGGGRFVVRFVAVETTGSETAILRRGVDTPLRIASGELEALIAAAEDSLLAFGRRSR